MQPIYLNECFVLVFHRNIKRALRRGKFNLRKKRKNGVIPLQKKKSGYCVQSMNPFFFLKGKTNLIFNARLTSFSRTIENNLRPCATRAVWFCFIS